MNRFVYPLLVVLHCQQVVASARLHDLPCRIHLGVQGIQHGGMSFQVHTLRQKKRRKRRGSKDSRGKIRDRVDIDQRPEVVETRSRIGDWEADLVCGAGASGYLVTLVERVSRRVLIGFTKRVYLWEKKRGKRGQESSNVAPRGEFGRGGVTTAGGAGDKRKPLKTRGPRAVSRFLDGQSCRANGYYCRRHRRQLHAHGQRLVRLCPRPVVNGHRFGGPQ